MIVVDSAAVVDALTVAPAARIFAPNSPRRSGTRRHCWTSRSSPHFEDALIDFDDLAIQPDCERSAYNAAYVALADALRCPLVTRDARLARSSGHDVEIRAR